MFEIELGEEVSDHDVTGFFFITTGYKQSFLTIKC